MYEWNRNVHEAVYSELREGNLPILLGGDHSLGIGSISAVARHCRETGKNLRILWLDAHADFNTSELSPSGNLHGMPLACLCGFGPEELVRLGVGIFTVFWGFGLVLYLLAWVLLPEEGESSSILESFVGRLRL